MKSVEREQKLIHPDIASDLSQIILLWYYGTVKTSSLKVKTKPFFTGIEM